jgi:hypothetical protein
VIRSGRGRARIAAGRWPPPFQAPSSTVPDMDSYQVTDEGDGLVRVDAQIRLVRKPIAVAMCDEVDKVVAGYDGFRILMNMSAMSKGTPAAGFFVLRTMKKYPLRALALYGANGFMRGMAKVVLGLARFESFELFDDEALARDWLDRAGSEPTAGPATATPGGPTGAVAGPAAGVRRLAVPAGVLASGAVLFRVRRRRRRRRLAGAQSASAG